MRHPLLWRRARLARALLLLCLGMLLPLLVFLRQSEDEIDALSASRTFTMGELMRGAPVLAPDDPLLVKIVREKFIVDLRVRGNTFFTSDCRT